MCKGVGKFIFSEFVTSNTWDGFSFTLFAVDMGLPWYHSFEGNCIIEHDKDRQRVRLELSWSVKSAMGDVSIPMGERVEKFDVPLKENIEYIKGEVYVRVLKIAKEAVKSSVEK